MPRIVPAIVAFILITASWAGAQTSAVSDPIPQKRAIVTPNTDFFGGDIRSIFDTTLQICRQACEDDATCRAITFNTGAKACFLKTGVEEMSPYDDAISAIFRVATQENLLRAADRAADLSFLSRDDLSGAKALAEAIGFDHPVTFSTEEEIEGLSRVPVTLGDPAKALKRRGELLNLRDTAFGWLDLSHLYLRQKPRNTSDQRLNKRRAMFAAINAYLRAAKTDTRASALRRIGTLLEDRGKGRETIPLHRLVTTLEPSPEADKALDRAINLFGFRVADHSVDNNSAEPRICVVFSEPLDDAGTEYTPFLRLPSTDLPVEAEGAQLCITGVEHGRRYAVTLREGLPAKSGETLLKSVTLDIYVRDRTPSVRFTGSGYILPKSPDAAVPVVSVNVSEVDVAIHRIGDRNLLPALQDNLIGKNLTAYAESALASERGEKVWSGIGTVTNDLNANVTTALPIGDAITTFEPGLYVMTARVPNDDEPYERAATQWFIVTDLGLASVAGEDGLHVFTRSLSSTEPVPLALVTLIARNNTVLAETVSDPDGHVRFDPGLTRGTGGLSPAMITVREAGGDFAFLDLTAPALDLTDRGVEGRPAPPPIDVFLSTERGAYRPGETVFATILARDTAGAALRGVPLTAILFRPDGVEHSRALLSDTGAGGRVHAVSLDQGALTGTWRIAVHADPDAQALVTQAFLVEDLVPEKIDFDIVLASEVIDPSKPPSTQIDVRYLYGAPGAGLSLQGTFRLAPTTALPGFSGYVFGRHDEPTETVLATMPPGIETSPEGRAEFTLPVPSVPVATQPKTLTATVRVMDGSNRPVERVVTHPVLPDGPRIGIKPLFDGAVEENGLARFEVIAVDTDLTRSDMPGASWTLTRVITSYQWYQTGRRWRFEPITRRERIANGMIDLSATVPQKIEAAVGWGRYELQINDTKGGQTASSVTFHAGWYSADSGTDTPDILKAGLDKARYAPGDTARLRVVARNAGKLFVRVVSDRLIDMTAIAVEEGETEVPLTVTDAWGAGAYVTATLVRPMNVDAKRNPARAIGVNWVEVEPGSRKITAQILSEPEANPRSPLDVSLQVEGIAEGTDVWASIAVVDLGILNLTGFETPDPEAHYFGQRQLGVEMRDVYGRLIDGFAGIRGKLRSGGDSNLLSAEAPPPDQELVAQFAGPLKADPSGRITAQVPIPDFNGTVRVMAVLWSDEGIGHATQDILIRDPIVVTAATPRFLAPGDQSRIRLDLAHAFGDSGDLTVRLTASDGLTIEGPTTHRLSLGDLERATIDIPVRAVIPGNSRLEIETTTPDGKRLMATRNVSIRNNDPEIARSTRLTLKPADGRLVVGADAFAGLEPGTGYATLAVGPLARLNAPALLNALDRYPYGCTEQITSAALPLLYLDQVAEAMGADQRRVSKERVEQAITQILARQSSTGAFGLWSAGSDDLWLSAYVTDFLSRAKEAGHSVPTRGFTGAIDYLRNRVNYAGDFEKGGEDIAYALYVLARSGEASIGDLRYYADAKVDAFATPLALAQIAAALSTYGDQARADALFRKAGQKIAAQSSETRKWRTDYGSYTRDRAAVITLAAETGTEALTFDDLAAPLATFSTGRTFGSTQENAWTLLAAHALAEDAALESITVNDRALGNPIIRFDASAGSNDAITITNSGQAEVATVLTIFGIPSEPEPASGDGYRITREHYTLDGQKTTLAAVPTSTRIVTILTITPERDSQARLMVTDPLPAGFEIDNPRLLRAGDIRDLDWLDPVTSTEHTAFRLDRFEAAVDWKGTKTFRLAYLMRAVTPGAYHQPAAAVEDMYRPLFRARTDASTAIVTE